MYLLIPSTGHITEIYCTQKAIYCNI
uniref:Uncharacterized protein n=1 Tax=Anguilla anguilla TaxID=7936 RepID=A0A0E9RXB2_ANGAN